MKKNILNITTIVLIVILGALSINTNKVLNDTKKSLEWQNTALQEANKQPGEQKEPETVKTSYEDDPVDFYRELSEEMAVIQFYDSADLTLEDLQNRNGTIIIEKCIGVVETPEKDGRVINYVDPDHYYISYRGVEDCNVGDVILTYFIYNPDTNYEDDILYRFDYIIDSAAL